METTVKDAGKVRVIDLTGELTIGGPEVALREAVQGLLNDGHSQILIHMNRLGRIDSAGLGEMVACKWRVDKRNGAIKLVVPEGHIKNVFIMTQLHKIFEIFDDELTGVGSF